MISHVCHTFLLGMYEFSHLCLTCITLACNEEVFHSQRFISSLSTTNTVFVISISVNVNTMDNIMIIGCSHAARMRKMLKQKQPFQHMNMKIVGIDGETAKNECQFWTLSDIAELSSNGTVVLMLGGNDCDSQQSVLGICGNLLEIMLRLSDSRNVVFCQILKRQASGHLGAQASSKKVDMVNALMMCWCHYQQNCSFLTLKDSSTGMVLDDYCSDGRHLTEQAYHKVLSVIRQHVKKMLSK